MECDKFEEVPYDSPIRIIHQITEKIAEDTDKGVMQAIAKVGFDIDKDKMVRILQQDKTRYTDAFSKGFRHGYERREAEIVHCEECEYGEELKRMYACRKEAQMLHDPDWYCAGGKRKEEQDG